MQLKAVLPFCDDVWQTGAQKPLSAFVHFLYYMWMKAPHEAKESCERKGDTHVYEDNYQSRIFDKP